MTSGYIMRHRRNPMPLFLCILLISEVILFPLSWIVSTVWQDSGTVSMLSPDGIRWFIGSHAKLLATPHLIWILLAGISAGLFKSSGLSRPRKGFPLQFTILALIVQTIAVGLLSFSPHAVLLSATGSLIDSSFSAGVIPMLCFITSSCALTYGILDSRYTTLHHIYISALQGISMAAPYILLYIFIAQLYFSIRYIIPQTDIPI